MVFLRYYLLPQRATDERSRRMPQFRIGE